MVVAGVYFRFLVSVFLGFLGSSVLNFGLGWCGVAGFQRCLLLCFGLWLVLGGVGFVILDLVLIIALVLFDCDSGGWLFDFGWWLSVVCSSVFGVCDLGCVFGVLISEG